MRSACIVQKVSQLWEWEICGFLLSIWAGPRIVSQLSCYWISNSFTLLLLLLLSCFSRVQLCATPQMAAYQAPLSPGFSKQEHWNGLPFLPPMYESESEVTQSFLTFSHPMDCSAPGSSIHGIFQARVLEWGAVAISTRYLHAPPNLLSIYPLFFVPEELKQ